MNALPILVTKPTPRTEAPPYEPSPAEIAAAIFGARPVYEPVAEAAQPRERRVPTPAPSPIDDAFDEAEIAAQFERPEHDDTTPDEYEPHRDDDAQAARPRRRRRGGRGRGEGTESTDSTESVEGEETAARSPLPGKKLPPAKIDLPEKFRELGVDETGLAAMAAFGFDTPSPIQALAIPLMLQGGDVVGLAQTGTGKTIAFGLPLAAAIDPMEPDLQALVLVPTRELARQVSETLEHLGLFYGFTVVTLTGGTRVAGDIQRLRDGAQVMVGTPGRVIDHIKRGNLSLRTIRFAVLDEADEMLDIGFARDIDYILRSVPKERQSALFSATMPESIRRLVWRYLRNSQEVSVEPERRTAENVTQLYCEVAVRDKPAALLHLHRTLDLGRSLIFRKMKIGVDRLTRQLQDAGISARAIHGDLAQSERDSVLAGFKRGDIQFLVATNVAARGLDIPDVQHVINFDVPQNAEEYIHRIGRTARAGKSGSAVTFVGEWELAEWDKIRAEVGGVDVNRLDLPRHL